MPLTLQEAKHRLEQGGKITPEELVEAVGDPVRYLVADYINNDSLYAVTREEFPGDKKIGPGEIDIVAERNAGGHFELSIKPRDRKHSVEIGAGGSHIARSIDAKGEGRTVQMITQRPDEAARLRFFNPSSFIGALEKVTEQRNTSRSA